MFVPFKQNDSLQQSFGNYTTKNFDSFKLEICLSSLFNFNCIRKTFPT